MHEELDVIQLHIVGFPYRKDIVGHVSEFLAEAPGHAMTLRPHPGNAHDKQAIRAFDWQGRFVGFVSQRDLPVAWGALRSSGSQSLRGMIVSTNIPVRCSSAWCVRMTALSLRSIRRSLFLTGNTAAPC